jgi:rhamnulokinase
VNLPSDQRALVAVDLGAESCRVSLLRWLQGKPQITLVHRFENKPRPSNGGLRWDLPAIEQGVDHGLRNAAEIAVEGIRSIAVDGWAVDYVRLNQDGIPIDEPFCYRDERTIAAESSLHQKLDPKQMRTLTGVQQLRINTLYQLYADALAGLDPHPWLNLPEYILARWGAARVAEQTNATHTQLVELHSPRWCREIFQAAGLDLSLAPQIVPPGTCIGKLRGPLAHLSSLHDTLLIAPACHDTASAIAGIGAAGNDWAYISSGTWSLVGTVLETPCNNDAARALNFTNFGAVGGRILFHKNVNGMWLLKQCIEYWAEQGHVWTVHDLIDAAESAPLPQGLITVDDPDLLLPGNMPTRINHQRAALGLPRINEHFENAPQCALLIFHSLAARYAEVLSRLSDICEKPLRRLFIVGGGSQNSLLNRLTAKATGLDVYRGAPESATHGNFAVQLAALNGDRNAQFGVDPDVVSRWATFLTNEA